MSEEAQPKEPRKTRTPRKTSYKESLEKHPLPILCAVAIASGGFVFTVMKWTWDDVQKPRYEQRLEAETARAETASLRLNQLTTKASELQSALKARETAVADLESKVRIYEQNLNLLSEQGRIAKETITELSAAKYSSDQKLLEKASEKDALSSKIGLLEAKLAATTGPKITQQKLEGFIITAQRQRDFFILRAKAASEKVRNAAFEVVNRETSKFAGKLEQGISYKDGYNEVSRIKLNLDKLISFEIQNTEWLLKVVDGINSEILERLNNHTFNGSDPVEFAKAIAKPIESLDEYEKFVDATPKDLNQNANDWLTTVEFTKLAYGEHWQARGEAVHTSSTNKALIIIQQGEAIFSSGPPVFKSASTNLPPLKNQ